MKDGKKHYASFTAPTKKEAELKASLYLNSKKRASSTDITVGSAVDAYLKAHEGVLAKNTYRSYKNWRAVRFGKIEDVPMSKLTNKVVQEWIAEMAETLSTSTVMCAYSLMVSSLRFFDEDTRFRVKLPKRQKRRVKSMTSEEVRMVCEKAQPPMKACIMLAAFCSLRRSEICALTYGDIKDGMVHVHSGMVKNINNEWEISHPKTVDSDRYVRLPSVLVDEIGSGDPDESIVGINPDQVTARFKALAKSLGIDASFHSLRHYFASIGAVLNIPSLYLAGFGGWESSGQTMKSVYQNEISGMDEHYGHYMADYFDGVIKKEGT